MVPKWLLLWVFAKASLHPISVIMAGHVQDGATTSRVRREIGVFIATCRFLVEGGRGLGEGYTCTDMNFGTTAIASLCLSCSQEVKAVVELHFPNAQHHGCYYHFM